MPAAYRLLSFLNCGCWALLGLLTIAGILHDEIVLPINLLFGCSFLAIAFYLYHKARVTSALVATLCRSGAAAGSRNLIRRFVRLEKCWMLLSLLVVVILLSGAISRVFGERMPVFG